MGWLDSFHKIELEDKIQLDLNTLPTAFFFFLLLPNLMFDYNVYSEIYVEITCIAFIYFIF